MELENSYKREYLFKNFSVKKRMMIEMDDVSYYSVTDSESAERISRFLINHLTTTQKINKKNADIVILDGMACIGGNTFSFATNFGKVISNEYNTKRYGMLKHNVTSVMGYQNVVMTNECILSLALKEDMNYDILFLDPEWGGPDYKSKNELKLTIGMVDLETFVFNVFTNKPKCEIIMLKLPANYAFTQFVQQINEYNCDLNYALCKLKKMVIILIYREKV